MKISKFILLFSITFILGCGSTPKEKEEREIKQKINVQDSLDKGPIFVGSLPNGKKLYKYEIDSKTSIYFCDDQPIMTTINE
jgi:hypothetical protein